MQVNSGVAAVLQLIVFILIVGVAGAAAWWFLTRESTPSDTPLIAEMERLHASAQVYYSRLRFFDGVCSDIGVPDYVTCEESSDAYVLEVLLNNGEFYCADSTDFIGTKSTPRARALACN